VLRVIFLRRLEENLSLFLSKEEEEEKEKKREYIF